MYQVQAGHVSQLNEFKGPNVIAPGAKTHQVVELARRMQRGCLLPPSLVRSSTLNPPIRHGTKLDPTSADQMLASGSNEARRYPTFRDAFPSGIEGEAAAYRCFGRQTRGHGGVAAQAL
jgi:hypothetical protein